MVTRPNLCSSAHATKQNIKDQINLPFLVYHRNIRGLNNKTNELLDSIAPSLPQVIYITEHHCKEHEIASLPIRNYSLAANFCRIRLKQGGTCIFVYDLLPFSTTDLKKFCLEQDIEESAISITLT
jgi:hypothetical protein